MVVRELAARRGSRRSARGPPPARRASPPRRRGSARRRATGSRAAARRRVRRSAPSRSPRRSPPRRAPPRSPPAACTGRTGASASARSTSAVPSAICSRFHSDRSWSSSSTSSPAGEARAARRDSCSSISASSPTASGLGQQLHQQPPQADRLGREIVPRERRAGRGRVALVEHQVDHVQHGCRAGRADRPATGTWYGIRASRILPWRARSAAPRVGAAGEEGARDLLGREPTDLAQGQRDLGVGRKRGVAAGEDQAEPVVLDAVVVRVRGLRGVACEPLGRARRARRRTGRGGGCRRWP